MVQLAQPTLQILDQRTVDLPQTAPVPCAETRHFLDKVLILHCLGESVNASLMSCCGERGLALPPTDESSILIRFVTLHMSIVRIRSWETKHVLPCPVRRMWKMSAGGVR